MLTAILFHMSRSQDSPVSKSSMLMVNLFHTSKRPATRRRSPNLWRANLALQTKANRSLVTVRSLNVRKREVDVVAMVVVVTVKPNVTTTILGRRVTRAISRTLRSKRAVRIKLYIER